MDNTCTALWGILHLAMRDVAAGFKPCIMFFGPKHSLLLYIYRNKDKRLEVACCSLLMQLRSLEALRARLGYGSTPANVWKRNEQPEQALFTTHSLQSWIARCSYQDFQKFLGAGFTFYLVLFTVEKVMAALKPGLHAKPVKNIRGGDTNDFDITGT